MADLYLTVAQGSARRWQTRQQEREEIKLAIREGQISNIEPAERIQKRLTYQVPIRRIEELTELDFGNLRNAGPIEAPEAVGRERFGERELAGPEEATF